MPTGYTANIENDITFEEYALHCARAFGACMHQRDSSQSENPKLVPISSYHVDKLIELDAELGSIKTMNREQREAYGEELKNECISSLQTQFNEAVLLRNKYEAMLVKVNAWSPPTSDHIELKQFMINQINESMQYDCRTDYYIDVITKKSELNPTEFVDNKISELSRSIEYHVNESQNEQARTYKSNKWITELYDSLNIEIADEVIV